MYAVQLAGESPAPTCPENLGQPVTQGSRVVSKMLKALDVITGEALGFEAVKKSLPRCALCVWPFTVLCELCDKRF